MKGCNESPQDHKTTYLPVGELVTFTGPVLHLVGGTRENKSRECANFDVASILPDSNFCISGMAPNVLYQPTMAASHLKGQKIAMMRF